MTPELPEPRTRAAVYVVRGHGKEPEVLVFDHVDHPEAGTQIPGGGVEPGETLDEAARREVLEETGLCLTGPLRGVAATRTSIDVPPGEQVTVFFAAEAAEPRDEWEHRVPGGPRAGTDAGLLFRCYFVPLARAEAAGANYHFRHAHLLRE